MNRDCGVSRSSLVKFISHIGRHRCYGIYSALAVEWTRVNEIHPIGLALDHSAAKSSLAIVARVADMISLK